jgi:hypothetical protein
VSCYSSGGLVNWTFRNDVLKLSDPENFGPTWVLERPKVFYNPGTKKFVMYMHIDGPAPGETGGYKLARVGVAVSGTVDGDYRYLKSFRPLGHESRDIGQFIDDDGTPYLIFEDRPLGFRIATLSADYLTVEKEVCLIPMHLEGGAVVHYQGLYYAIGSALTGWDPNPNKYATAKSLAGGWPEFKDIAPAGTNEELAAGVPGAAAPEYASDCQQTRTQKHRRSRFRHGRSQHLKTSGIRPGRVIVGQGDGAASTDFIERTRWTVVHIPIREIVAADSVLEIQVISTRSQRNVEP